MVLQRKPAPIEVDHLVQLLNSSEVSDGAKLTACCSELLKVTDADELSSIRCLPVEIIRDHFDEITRAALGRKQVRPKLTVMLDFYYSLAREQWPDLWTTNRMKDVAAMRILVRAYSEDADALRNLLTDFVTSLKTPGACRLSRLLANRERFEKKSRAF